MRSAALISVAFSLATATGPAHAQIIDLFKRVSPAVVVLHTVQRGPAQQGGQMSFEGLGSGVLVDDTQIITAAHVVQTADQVEVEFKTGQRIFAAVISSDPLSDLALLQLEEEPADVRPVRLGDSDDVEIGSEVFVVGAPFGLTHSLTVGHISARRNGDGSGELADDVELFQTDAAINQGNSGGPMFNMAGEVIGIVSYILSQSGGFEGLGFVITANTARRVLFEERAFWSGMTGFVIEGALAQLLNVPERAGYLVQNVAANSPAQQAGLRPSLIPAQILGRDFALGGDIILSVDDIQFSQPDYRAAIANRLQSLSIGERLTINVLRSGQRVELRYHRLR